MIEFFQEDEISNEDIEAIIAKSHQMISEHPTEILLDSNPDIQTLQDSVFFNQSLWIDDKFSKNPKIHFEIKQKSIG